MGIDPDKKEFGSWWMWVLGLVVVTSIVFGGLRILGVFGERIVFENSFQYKEARKSEVVVFEAQLAEIERKLGDDALTDSERNSLAATASAIRIQLRAARSKQ